jgi:hypothetical protein
MSQYREALRTVLAHQGTPIEPAIESFSPLGPSMGNDAEQAPPSESGTPTPLTMRSLKIMNRYVRSMATGFIATVVLSLLMLVKGAMEVMPELNPVSMLSDMAHEKMGMPAIPMIGWLAHFMIGTVLWGILFTLLYPRLPGQDALVKGLSFSTLAWLLMMLLLMPMMGAGLFGLKLGMMAPGMTLLMHLIWGAVLGYTYGKSEQARLSHSRDCGNH